MAEASYLAELLQKILDSEKPSTLLREIASKEIESIEEAALFCQVVAKLLDDVPVPMRYEDRISDVFYPFQSINSKRIYDYLVEHGLPHLYRHFDRCRDLPVDEAHYWIHQDLLFLLKLFRMYQTHAGYTRVIEAARRPYQPDAYMWSIIVGQVDAKDRFFADLFRDLGDPLPPGFIGISFLDAANRHAIAGNLTHHPFDAEEGRRRLHDWLIDPNPEHFSYAHSAAAALPFIRRPERDQLLALAMDHSDGGVQMEAAWASARLGSESGIKLLARFSRNVHTCRTACAYLNELGRADAIPEEVQEPDFQALAEMSGWLQHPNEFGAPPDELVVYDTRELYWPPTNDRRQLWLLRYTYRANENRAEEDSGLGMVGSVTFALFGENTADLEPMDAYGLYCAWELETRQDPRAPQKRSAKAGRAILEAHQNE